jgi:hypothetical protein
MDNLGSYLNDHLAGSVSAIELLDHLIKGQAGQPLEEFLVNIRDEVKADQEILQGLIGKLDMEESAVRKAGAWLVEKVGEVKIAVGGSEVGGLGLLQAFEVLGLGIMGKKLLWRSLSTIEADIPELQGLGLRDLEQRAQEQFDRVEKERLHIARDALGPI